jgi:hypothetical protein
MPKESKEFLEKKTLMDLGWERELQKHKLKMEELKFIRESEDIKHKLELERQRIKSAEIRKSMQERFRR